MLLSRAEMEIQRRGGRLLLIETSDLPVYASARRLYQSSGYRLEAVVQDFYGPGDSLLIYSKKLLPQPFTQPTVLEVEQPQVALPVGV